LYHLLVTPVFLYKLYDIELSFLAKTKYKLSIFISGDEDAFHDYRTVSGQRHDSDLQASARWGADAAGGVEVY
jgi:hypothetical protein